MIKDKLGYKYHSGRGGLSATRRAPYRIQDGRGSSLCLGKAAVELALKGKNSVMPTIVRVSDKPYNGSSAWPN